MTDRHLSSGLPPIELTDLRRSIHRPLKRPGRPGEQRPHLPQIVIHHGLTRRAPQRLQQLPDPDARKLRIPGQQPVDLGFKRLQHARLSSARAAALRAVRRQLAR